MSPVALAGATQITFLIMDSYFNIKNKKCLSKGGLQVRLEAAENSDESEFMIMLR